LVPPAQACFCFSPERPCDNNHEVAFVGHVTQVQEFGRGANAKLRVHLVIREAFRGVEGREVEIVTSATSCGVAFQDGQDYLVFANKREGSDILDAHACSGTKLVSRSGQELEHLRAVARGEGRSGVYGFVTANPSDIVPPMRASKPVAGVSIQLSYGNESQRAFTDAEGKYEFGLLPAGRYQIQAELSNVPERQRSFDIDVPAGACRVQPFLSVRAGRISGRLVDSRNQPIAGVFVEIEAIPPTPQSHPLLRMPTDSEGRFVHDWLESGEYVLGINLAGSARDFLGKPSRYSRTYYPGVTNRGEAGVLKLEGGQNIDDLQFRLSSTK
jgi:Carboxypeptidase regulatory-like domain